MNRESFARAAVWLVSLAAVGLGPAMFSPASAADWDATIRGDIVGAVDGNRGRERPSLARSATGVFVAGAYEGALFAPSVFRLTPEGAPQWRVSPGIWGVGAARPVRMVASDSGESLVLSVNATKLDAAGTPLWTYYTELAGGQEAASGLLLPNGDALIVNPVISGSRVQLRHLDGTSGRLLHALLLDDVSYFHCSPVSLAVAGTAAYIGFSCDSNLMKVDLTDFSVAWRQPMAAAGSIHADDTGVYVQTTTRISKIGPAGGEPLWVADRASGVAIEGLTADGDLILATPGSGSGPATTTLLERIRRSTGTTVWSAVVSGLVDDAEVKGSDLVVAGHVPDTKGGGSPFLSLHGVNDGAALWRSNLASTDWLQLTVDAAAISGTQVMAVGTRCPASLTFWTCQTVLWNLNTASGSLASVGPLQVRSSVYGSSVAAANGDVWTAVVESAGNDARLQVTAHRGVDGVQLVQTRLPLEPELLLGSTVEVRASADGDLVVLVSSPLYYSPSQQDGAVLMKVNGSTGELRWKRPLLPALSVLSFQMATHLIGTDLSGNVFVALHELGEPIPSVGLVPNQRKIVKFAAVDGAELMAVQFTPADINAWAFPYVARAAPNGLVIGNDLFIAEAPASETSQGVRRVSGSTGATAWTNEAALGFPYSPDPSSVFANKSVPGGQPKILRLDATTGATLWEASYPGPASDQNFWLGYWTVRTDVARNQYVFSEALNSANTTHPKGLMFALDAATGQLRWLRRFDDAQSSEGRRPALVALIGDSAYIQRDYPRSVSDDTVVLSAFDLATGIEQGSRMIASSLLLAPQVAARGVGKPIATLGSDLLYQWLRRPNPVDPPSVTLARRSVGSTTNGDLRVTLKSRPVSAGSVPTLDFTFTTRNADTAAVHDIRSMMGIPSDAVVENVACSLAGAPCTAGVGAQQIEIIHDMPAAGELVITGRVRFLNTYYFTTLPLRASSLGTYELIESTLNDNFASILFAPNDILFLHGFD